MYITTNNHFIAKNFRILTFYGEETCFCWNENKLVIFPYKTNGSASARILTAPASIKTIQCFTGRIFLICLPQGIYKLSRDLEFAVLSKSAIGMGTVFYEVLTPRNKYLYLDDKREMRNKILFQLSSEESDSRNLCVYLLNVENAAESFMETLTNNDLNAQSLCIIAEEKKLFTLMNETVQLIYNSVYSIRDIVPIQKNSKVAGLFLLTNTDVITIIHSENNVLIFENVCLGTKIKAICIGFNLSLKDTLWIVYSDESKLYYANKELSTDNIKHIKVQDKSFNCLQFYDSKIILGLTTNKQLIELSVDSIERTLSSENNKFINLHPDMLKGTELIMDKIYKGTQELCNLNKTLMIEEDKLKRINLYSHKQRIRIYPKMLVQRIANRLFLSINFHDTLPQNSWIVFNLKLNCQNMFYMKKVIDQETIIDIHIPEDETRNFSQITVDLIALKDKKYPWCLVRDYLIEPRSEKNKKKRTRSDKIDFINSQIAVLQNFIKQGNVDVQKLSEIKKRLRKEFNDI